MAVAFLGVREGKRQPEMVLDGENQTLEWETQWPWERVVGGGHRDAKGERKMLSSMKVQCKLL